MHPFIRQLQIFRSAAGSVINVSCPCKEQFFSKGHYARALYFTPNGLFFDFM